MFYTFFPTSALIYFFIFVLGAIIGSFLNVVILRYGTGLSIGGKSRSQCFSCGKTLRWFELVPIISYLSLRGRCGTCKSRISIQYPLIEFLTGALFIGVFIHTSHLNIISPLVFGITMFYYLLIFSLLLVIFFYDLRHTIIPDGLVYSFILLGLLHIIISSGAIHILQEPYVYFLVAGPILFLPFALLWLVSHGRWIGFGDAKLALGIGWFLGLSQGTSAILLAFWIGAAISIILLGLQKLNRGKLSLPFTRKALTIKSEIPFAPFLITGSLIAFFGHIGIVTLLAIL